MRSDRLESWTHAQSEPDSLIDILRDALELKKLNSNLMKPLILDDLIADIYALYFERHAPQLHQQANEEENKERMRVDHVLMSTDGASEGPSVPNDLPGPTGEPTDAPVPKPRFKGVGRREVQRRAEALVNKPAPPPPPKPAPSDSAQTPARQLATGVFIPRSNLQDDEQAAGSSAPASVLDDADDESELSDVEEERFARPMFPGLIAAAHVAPSTPGSDRSRDEGDGGDGDPRSPAPDRYDTAPEEA